MGLLDLCEVLSHGINRIARSTSHVVHLRGGGCVRFAYSDSGELLELSATAVRSATDRDGCISFGALSNAFGGAPGSIRQGV